MIEDIEQVDKEKDYLHSIISLELKGNEKEKLLSAFESLHQTSNQECGKKVVYEMTGCMPKLEDKNLPDTDLDGYMKWLFEQHGYSEIESTTISKNI